MSPSTTPDLVVLEALSRLAIARGVVADDVQLDVYADALADVSADAVQAACVELSRQSRKDYETAMPSVGVIRDTVTSVQRRAIAARSDWLLPPAPGERTYACDWCLDDPNGFVLLWCPELPCGAWHGREHRPHEFAARCPCWLRRHADAIRFTVQDDTHRPASPEVAMLDALQRGDYRPERFLLSHGRPDVFTKRQRYLEALAHVSEVG